MDYLDTCICGHDLAVHSVEKFECHGEVDTTLPISGVKWFTQCTCSGFNREDDGHIDNGGEG